MARRLKVVESGNSNKCIKPHFVRGDTYSLAGASRKYSQQVAALYAKR